MFYAILIIGTILIITLRIIKSIRLREKRKQYLQQVLREFNEKYFEESE